MTVHIPRHVNNLQYERHSHDIESHCLVLKGQSSMRKNTSSNAYRMVDRPLLGLSWPSSNIRQIPQAFSAFIWFKQMFGLFWSFQDPSTRLNHVTLL